MTLISNQFGEIGQPGWIRQDIDNNGQIQLYDIIIISNHYEESY
jgi:hypothetical protein